MKKTIPFLTLWLLGWLLCHPATMRADVWLVSVGISDYPGVENDLRLPVKDAETIAGLYDKNATAHTVLLTDDKATVSAIVNKMNSLYARAKKDDIVVFFFSGHGSRGAFCAYDGFLDYSRIRDSMAKSRSKNKMIFADACFSGKMRQAGHSHKREKLNVMLFLSSRENEYSLDGLRGMKNGVFTSCLLRSLRGGADANGDRVITARELFDAVSGGVKTLSEGRQHPVMWGNFDHGMPVMKW